MDVRRRIAALARRFKFDSGGIGAWEVFQLIQIAYIPTVYYSLEFLTSYAPYVKRIQTHANDAICSLYKIPLRLATTSTIILANKRITPVHFQGTYLQKRYYTRMINYGYDKDMLW